MSNTAERLTAIDELLHPLVRIDDGVMNLGVRLKRLREEDPHGIFSKPGRADVSVAQFQEVQDRISAWVDPIIKSVAEAKEKCKGVSRHLSSLVDDPIAWETDRRTDLRLLGEALSTLPCWSGSDLYEQQITALAAQLYLHGTRLQDARETIAGTMPVEPSHEHQTRRESTSMVAGARNDKAPEDGPAEDDEDGAPCTKDERRLRTEDIVEVIERSADQIMPDSKHLPPEHLCYFFFSGVGSPLDPEEHDGGVPRLWYVASVLQQHFTALAFERYCATLELAQHHEIAHSIRQRARDLCNKCDEVLELVEKACKDAAVNANIICFKFIGAQNPEQHESLINWADYERGETWSGPLGGDRARRKALAAAIYKGPPLVCTIRRPSNKPPTDPTIVADDYWGAINDADYKIRKLRFGLRHHLELFATYLKAIAEHELHHSAIATPPRTGLPPTARPSEDVGQAARTTGAQQRSFSTEYVAAVAQWVRHIDSSQLRLALRDRLTDALAHIRNAERTLGTLDTFAEGLRDGGELLCENKQTGMTMFAADRLQAEYSNIEQDLVITAANANTAYRLVAASFNSSFVTDARTDLLLKRLFHFESGGNARPTSPRDEYWHDKSITPPWGLFWQQPIRLVLRSRIMQIIGHLTYERELVSSASSMSPEPEGVQAFYLVTSLSESPAVRRDTVFYNVVETNVAQTLCRLFAKEYGNGGKRHFAAVPVTDVPGEEQILLDEALDWLQIYDDPDPGIYDPPPSKEMMTRAQFAHRATTWEAMIKARLVSQSQTSVARDRRESSTQTTENKNASPGAVANGANIESLGKVRDFVASLAGLRLTIGELLQTAEKTDRRPEPQIKAYRDAMRRAESLLDGIGPNLDRSGYVEAEIRENIQNICNAISPIASDHNDRPGQYPLGKDVIQAGWDAVKNSMAIEMSLMSLTMKPEELQMPVEDRRISGLVVLMLLAQAYYKMLESTIPMADWCSALDLELNQSYLWVITSLSNLLKNHEDLKDFPVQFEPLFPDLYPSTIRDTEWHDMIAIDAERFLSTVQRYVHTKGMYEPQKASVAWVFVEIFRPSVETAIQRALDYNDRMRQHVQKVLKPSIQKASENDLQAMGTHVNHGSAGQEIDEEAMAKLGGLGAVAKTTERDPATVWLAAETMKSIACRLINHSMMTSIGKPSEYDDRNRMGHDFRLAQKHGYLLVSVARQLSLDAKSLTRILREDRLWEYPVEKDDVAVFRAAADVAERICTEARVWCAEAGIDPEAFLHGPATTSSIAASPKADAPVPTAPPAVVPTTSKPMTSAEPDGPAVVLGKPGMPCHVLNTEKPALTDGQHAVVAALLEAGPNGLSKDAMESVRPGARGILKRLIKDEDWAKVILRAGKTNGRYRIIS